MTAEFRPLQPQALETLAFQAANLAGFVDLEAYLSDQDRRLETGQGRLLQAVDAVTSLGTPSGRALVRRIAESDASRYPDKLSQMIETVEGAKQRLIHRGHLPNQRSHFQQEIFERADRVDPIGNLVRFAGVEPRPRTFNQAVSVIEADTDKREAGSNFEARIRRVGSNFINLMKRHW